MGGKKPVWLGFATGSLARWQGEQFLVQSYLVVRSGKYLTSISRQHAAFYAGGSVLLALGEIQTRPIGENPSRACLVLPGALRICLARYFTTPSRQDIDRASTLTAASRILDGADAGQAARMLAKP
ncbi:hypothetical protein PspCFBP13528_07060 [Pseudomonas sp. CFBP13528]|nr:hypothetical protein PspCFBP13528_07060 [Pseudomonas sp. CFBP13528]